MLDRPILTQEAAMIQQIEHYKYFGEITLETKETSSWQHELNSFGVTDLVIDVATSEDGMNKKIKRMGHKINKIK